MGRVDGARNSQKHCFIYGLINVIYVRDKSLTLVVRKSYLWTLKYCVLIIAQFIAMHVTQLNSDLNMILINVIC